MRYSTLSRELARLSALTYGKRVASLIVQGVGRSTLPAWGGQGPHFLQHFRYVDC